ncbi:unnamed protein product, partial [Laminaria digitata]
ELLVFDNARKTSCWRRAQNMTSERIPGGGDPAGASIDTSWLRETSDPSGGDRARGRGGRRRARRRTLSPSIGSKSFMSGVDFDDPESFPDIPLAGGVGVSGSSGSGSGSMGIVAAEGGGNAALVISPKGQIISPSPGSDAQDARLPDPSAVANLFDADETTPEPKPKNPPPLGLLQGSLGNQNQACSVAATERDHRSGKKGQGQGSAKSVKGSSRDARTSSIGVENRQPGLGVDRPVAAAEGAAATAAAVVTSSSPPTSTSSRTPSSTTTATKARPATTTVTREGGKEEGIEA